MALRAVSALLTTTAAKLLAFGLLALPAYGLLMGVWMHVPLSGLLETLGPLEIASLLVANVYFAGARRTWRRARGGGGH